MLADPTKSSKCLFAKDPHREFHCNIFVQNTEFRPNHHFHHVQPSNFDARLRFFFDHDWMLFYSHRRTHRNRILHRSHILFLPCPLLSSFPFLLFDPMPVPADLCGF
uniref:Uncharacterized protein n=1 Tax=Cacopsylla melanoneura TaxID=428564 RepID=A0A8D8X2G0_9HEMI